jgi:hypothetical protein
LIIVYGSLTLRPYLRAGTGPLRVIVLEHGVVTMGKMAQILKDAVEEVSNLSVADQEKIGRDLLSHVEKLRRLRVEIDNGIHSLDAGRGRELDIEEFLDKMNARHGGS